MIAARRARRRSLPRGGTTRRAKGAPCAVYLQHEPLRAIIGFGVLVGDLADNVVEGINRIGALFYGPLLAAFACGILDRRARGPGVLAGVAGGLGINLVLAWMVGPRVFWMWRNVSGLVAAAVITVAVSRLVSPMAPHDGAGRSATHEALAAAGPHARRLIFILLGYAMLIGLVIIVLDLHAGSA